MIIIVKLQKMLHAYVLTGKQGTDSKETDIPPDLNEGKGVHGTSDKKVTFWDGYFAQEYFMLPVSASFNVFYPFHDKQVHLRGYASPSFV